MMEQNPNTEARAGNLGAPPSVVGSGSPESPRNIGSLKTRLLGEGSWVVVGQIGTLAGLVVATRALTRILEPEVFGTVQLLLGTLNFCHVVLNAPLLEAGLTFYPSARAQPDGLQRLCAVLNRGLLRSGALLTAFFFVGGWWLYEGPSTWAISAILTGLLAVETLRSLETTLQNAARRQAPGALWGLCEAWARPFLALGLVALLGSAPVVVLLGHFVAALLILLLFVCLTRPEGPRLAVALPADRSLSREVWDFALPLVPLGVFHWLAVTGDRYLVAGILGMTEAGIYIAASTLAVRPMGIGGLIVESTLRPHYYEALAREDYQTAERLFQLWLGLLALGGGGMTLLAFSASGWIVTVLLGPEYEAAAQVLPWLSLGSLLWVFGLAYQRRMYAARQTRALLALRCLTVPSTLAGVAWFASRSGALGAALAWAAGNGLELLLLVVCVHGLWPWKRPLP